MDAYDFDDVLVIMKMVLETVPREHPKVKRPIRDVTRTLRDYINQRTNGNYLRAYSRVQRAIKRIDHHEGNHPTLLAVNLMLDQLIRALDADKDDNHKNFRDAIEAIFQTSHSLGLIAHSRQK